MLLAHTSAMCADFSPAGKSLQLRMGSTAVLCFVGVSRVYAVCAKLLQPVQVLCV